MADGSRRGRAGPSPHGPDHRPIAAGAADRGATLPPEYRDCGPCHELRSDLLALTAALPFAALPARPRTFTLTRDQADRLRPGGRRRWVAAFATARDDVSRPLAIGFGTLGIVGVLLTAAPAVGPLGGAGAAATAAAPMELQAESPGLGGRGDAPYGGSGSAPDAVRPTAVDASGAPPAVPPMLVVSGLFLGAGASIAAARTGARWRRSRTGMR